MKITMQGKYMKDAMTVMAKPVTTKGALILDRKILAEAGLGKQARIIVKQGEIIVTYCFR